MKLTYSLQRTVIMVCLFCFVLLLGSCKENDVSSNRAAFEEYLSGGGDSGGDSGGTDDHGNFYYNATPISLNDFEFGEIEVQGDVDFFRIDNVPSSGFLTVYTTGSTDTVGTLLDSSLNELNDPVSDDDGGDGSNFSIGYSVSFSGTYYIKVEGFGSTSTGSYTLYTSFF